VPTKTVTRVVRQKKKGPVDPSVGLRIRTLRMQRGMTQAQLAGRDFTKGFISLVETGRTRMSLRAAEILAGRLSVGVTELFTPPSGELHVDVELTRAEALLSAGHASEAVTVAQSVEKRTTGLMRARALRLRARALLTERPREAIKSLDEAVRIFRAAGAKDMTVRALFDLARAHAFLEARGEALNIALQCEQLVASGDLVDRSFELQLLTFLAGVLIDVGDVAAADLRAERARALAEDIGDPRSTGNLYYGLAVTREQQGDLEAALQFARRSLREYEGLDDQAAIGSCWNTIGWIFVKRAQFARANEALARADTVAEKNHDGRLAAFVLQTRAELALARDNLDEAVRLARASIDHPQASGRCRAMSELVYAQAFARTKASDAQVNAAFEAAFAALATHGTRLLATAYQQHFEALTRRGRFEAANNAARRAMELLAPN
jgi:tetratricopeptide (TPR) repeat protein